MLKHLIARPGQYCREAFRQHRLFALLAVATVGIIAFVLGEVVLPAYRTPYNRTYTSIFGFASLKHRLKLPFQVETAPAQWRVLQHPVLGEGFMFSQPILVPVVPTDRVIAVHVTEGQRVHKGDLLAELDSTRAELRVHSAELAVATARSEQERVAAGSTSQLAQERPEKDRIEQTAAERQIELVRRETEMYRKLEAAGVLSKLQLLDFEKVIAQNEAALALSRFNLGMSSKGQPQSQEIAANAVAEDESVLAQQRLLLHDYKIYAPADGVIERVLIQPQEYNQDSGRPAFVLDAGLWFEAHFDQTTIGLIQPGDRAEVFLAAFPGAPVGGTVSAIVPLVSNNLAAPALALPARPATDAGTPEWPTTYKVRIECDPANLHLVAGLTGFARVRAEHETLAVPRSAILSMSAGSGIVHVVNGQQQAARAVTYGLTDENWAEITSGVAAGDKVITEGQLALQAGDHVIEVNPLTASNSR